MTRVKSERNQHGPIPCPNCANTSGRLHAVATVAQQPDDFKLTYRCVQCQHEWAVVKPAHWITKLGEE